MKGKQQRRSVWQKAGDEQQQALLLVSSKDTASVRRVLVTEIVERRVQLTFLLKPWQRTPSNQESLGLCKEQRITSLAGPGPALWHALLKAIHWRSRDGTWVFVSLSLYCGVRLPLCFSAPMQRRIHHHRSACRRSLAVNLVPRAYWGPRIPPVSDMAVALAWSARHDSFARHEPQFSATTTS